MSPLDSRSIDGAQQERRQQAGGGRTGNAHVGAVFTLAGKKSGLSLGPGIVGFWARGGAVKVVRTVRPTKGIKRGILTHGDTTAPPPQDDELQPQGRAQRTEPKLVPRRAESDFGWQTQIKVPLSNNSPTVTNQGWPAKDGVSGRPKEDGTDPAAGFQCPAGIARMPWLYSVVGINTIRVSQSGALADESGNSLEHSAAVPDLATFCDLQRPTASHRFQLVLIQQLESHRPNPPARQPSRIHHPRKLDVGEQPCHGPAFHAYLDIKPAAVLGPPPPQDGQGAVSPIPRRA
ncbi:hypothetical protein GGTG_12417 [Gaeumannomyces tritici R3-111a-1]|uniref:Uncharacterized protein n=1 Tax=Gaeumannomyces tritici (strain R3-111a-1) TaxID=644352 RepID=J3PFZ2_GAET3|nr:hypothetical protein GGTG_12417 [Gaeumannomyces tritici R3-111a-1]EJT70244.1 hypothetical protein GGTG_12417 [Gaeumannomyces tritici R3-111a-1]